MKGAPVKVGYLVKTFPKISETFILREVLALEAAGVELEIFALRQPEEEKTHALAAQVRARVSYLPWRLRREPLTLLWAQLVMLLTHPIGYCRALAFPLRHRHADRTQDFLQAACLAWRLRRDRIDHLHVHFINKPADVAALAQRMTGVPMSITAHAKDIYLTADAELARKMGQARFVVTCNEYNRRYLQERSPEGVSLLRIYHGIDPQYFRPNWTQGGAAEIPMILSVGRLREKKGFFCLLDACRLLNVGGQPFRCVIAGYGPLRAQLEQRIAEYGLTDKVSLTGVLTQDEIVELYRQATLFALPCQITEDGDRDGIPNVLIEAMAMELPVVTTNVSGIPELVDHNRNGLLLKPENPVALAAALKRLLDRPELRKELGQAARQKVTRYFSMQRNSELLRDLFQGEVESRQVETMLADEAIAQVKAG